MDGFFKLLKQNHHIAFLITGVVLLILGVLLHIEFKFIEISAYLIAVSLILLIRYFVNITFIESFSSKYPNLYFLIWTVAIFLFAVWIPQLLIKFLKVN